MPKPNILLITTDTQRCDTLRCMGYDFAISPHTDRLAAEGVMFTQGHTSSPVCGPTRCSLLTGLHTPVHGCIENGMPPYKGLLTFTDRLKEAGYTNIMSGKTHFGPLPDSFDIDFSTSGGKRGASGDHYSQHLVDHGYLRSDGHPNPIPEDLFFDAYVTTKTMEGIDQARAQSDAPFFAFCSMVSPHGPLDPPGKWADVYSEDMLPPLPKNPDTDHEPEHMQQLLALRDRKKYTPDEMCEVQRLYYGLAAYCDHQVGRLMTYLEENNLRENTLVIFTSDHGIDMFDHGFDDKHHWYDNTWRIPFIMSQPGTLKAGDTREFATWNDIPATILGAAGLHEPTFQGFDLYGPLVKNEPSTRRCAVGTIFKSCALATKRWKLEYYFMEGQARLFDRLKDPNEYEDLSQSRDHQPVLQALKEALLCWRADIMDMAHVRGKTGGGGPVAQRLAKWVTELEGTDAEERLNQKAEAIDAQFA